MRYDKVPLLLVYPRNGKLGWGKETWRARERMKNRPTIIDAAFVLSVYANELAELHLRGRSRRHSLPRPPWKADFSGFYLYVGNEK